jgi:DNA-binding CsgD family transcriptional regulator
MRSDAVTVLDPVTVERAEEVTRTLQRLVRCEAAAVVVRDPHSAAHVVLSSSGYEPSLLEHAVGDFLDDPVIRRIRAGEPRALRWSDIRSEWGVDFADNESAQRFLIPMGFHEGVTMRLATGGGRETGVVHVSWAKRTDATIGRRTLLEDMRGLLAGTCDVLARPRTMAAGLVEDACAVWVTAAGAVAELPDRPAGALLFEGGDLREHLRHRWAGSGSPREFLWLDGAGQYHRVEVFPCGGGDVLVASRSIAAPHGLTQRQLQVLGRVAAGSTNRVIARELAISYRTVTTHVEHLLTKLGCASRTELAARVLADGLLLAGASGRRR